MPSGGVRITGLNEAIRALQAMGLELDDLKSAFSEISQEAAAKASLFAPYAAAINYGWRAHNIAPQRFLQQADEAMRDKAVDMLDRAIDEAIKRRGLA